MNMRPTVILSTSLAFLSVHVASAGQVEKLLPTDGRPDAQFGCSVALEGDSIVVGSRGDDFLGEGAGAIYLFGATTGTQLHVIRPDDSEPGDRFGTSVTIDGGIVAAGAPYDDDRGVDAGAVYLFNASTGIAITKILPPPGSDGAQFGASIDSDGGLLVVGSPFANAADLYDMSTGAHLHQLIRIDGGSIDRFGGAVAIDGDNVVVGAQAHANGPLFLAGAAYLFDASTGSFRHKLLPNDAAVSDFFGSAVSVKDDVVLVGAWAKSIVFDHSGATYRFDADSGEQIGTRLVPADSADRDNFGFAIAAAGEMIWCGAPGDSDIAFESGSIYGFSIGDGSEQVEHHAFDAAALDEFGSAVAASARWLVVGAPSDDDSGLSSGAVYLHSLGACSSDLNDDGVLDVFDVIRFLEWFDEMSPGADWNDDGIFDIFDITSYLGAFSLGC
ncbi:MAG: hypothetical protein KDA28_05420 [Phycisphaerales bacterium]|nr:hypothetical protein [Phycisphaerales bacterium]